MLRISQSLHDFLHKTLRLEADDDLFHMNANITNKNACFQSLFVNVDEIRETTLVLFDIKEKKLSTKLIYMYVPLHLLKNDFLDSFIHLFTHSLYLCSAPSRNLLRGALSPVTAKEKCLKKLAERRHVVLG